MPVGRLWLGGWDRTGLVGEAGTIRQMTDEDAVSGGPKVVCAELYMRVALARSERLGEWQWVSDCLHRADYLHRADCLYGVR